MRAVAHFEEVEEVELPSMDDQNKTFRTRFIVIWLLMNSLLGTCPSHYPLYYSLTFVVRSTYDRTIRTCRPDALLPSDPLDHFRTRHREVRRSPVVPLWRAHLQAREVLREEELRR